VQFPIVFAGEVNDSTEFIDKYQLMVVPLISGSGMRIKIVEAMARGKCILTTSKGAEGIDAQNLNEIVIADNSVLMTEYLEKLFQNPNLIKDYGENAFKFASNNFKNEILINGLRNFYQHKLLAINDLS
jgi:glycosyltransferase involved in cell wall biosynthesis